MAFLQPQAPRQPFFRAPAVVVWLVACFALVHLARSLAGPALDETWIGKYAFIPARYAFMAAHGGGLQGWWSAAVPFVSYMALHNDLMHLAINSLMFLAFAPVVARRFGATLFLLFFCICGVAGAVFYLALNWGSPAAVIGASGAISGLMPAALRMLPTLGVQGHNAPLSPILTRQFLLFSLVWVVMNVIVGVTGIGFGGESGLIAWQAHLGGFLAGLVLTGPFDRLRPQPIGVALE